MWRVTLRDLQFRRRRFLIAVLATALVFAMTLLTAGASVGLHTQDRNIVESFDGDAWFVASGSSGPFTTTTPLPASVAAEIEDLPGVERATPVVLFRATIDNGEKDVNIIGVPPGGLGAPRVASGKAPTLPGEIAADTALGSRVGSRVSVGGAEMLVVGTVPDASYFFGTPTIYMTLAEAQAQFFSSVPVATAVVVKGRPGALAPGTAAMSVDQVVHDLARPTLRSDQTIQFINVLLWVAAVGVIGAIVYLSALERVRDFAVLKATGAATRSLMFGLAFQAVILSGGSALIAGVLANVLAPAFPFTVRIGVSSYLTLTAVAIVIGIAASSAGLRRVVATDPALAFGGS